VANVTFLPAAEADYQSALAWYRARSQQAADRFEAAVDAALQTIGDFPELYGSSMTSIEDVFCAATRTPSFTASLPGMF
jgi:plasmid stabilization system protein ParE